MTTSNVSADPYYTNAMDNFYSEYSHPTGTDLLAVGDMQTIGADGDVTQPIVYDRYIYANQKSKLRGLGDPIRGDLAITPCNYGWFNVSVTPSIDLQQGAMNVIGGVSNGTNQSLAELQYATSGGYQTAFGGVNLANQFETKYGAGLGDVNVVAFA
jgi:hypothetical protein